MKKVMSLLLMTALFGMCLAGSCESDDADEGKTPCEKEDDLITNAATDYCGPKTDECCYCQCYMQGKRYNLENGICTCNADTVDTDTADAGAEECEGNELQDAEHCLDNTESCTGTYLAKAETGCNMSQLD